MGYHTNLVEIPYLVTRALGLLSAVPLLFFISVAMPTTPATTTALATPHHHDQYQQPKSQIYAIRL